MTLNLEKSITLSDDFRGMRLDQTLAQLWPDYSRSRLTQWIRTQAITLNGQPTSPKTKVQGGEQATLKAELAPDQRNAAQAIPLDIVYEDDTLLIINKASRLVMYPAAGHHEGTLMNALLHHDRNLAHLPRAGIVHRLDQDTTGLLVVARTLSAHHHLVEQLQARSIKRQYQALVNGCFIAGGTVNAPIGRHAQQRLKMCVRADGKPAITHYRVKQRFQAHTLLDVTLETGRTHQIRVHMAHLKHAIVGDKTYGGRPHLPKAASPALQTTLQQFPRQALHAYALGLTHPVNHTWQQWEIDLPQDFAELCALLMA